MSDVKTIELYVHQDKSEIRISRVGRVRNPLGFYAPIGDWIILSSEQFLTSCKNIIELLLEEDPIWHDVDGKSMTSSAAQPKNMNAKEKRQMRNFKKLHAYCGGYWPAGITIVGASKHDEFKIHFLPNDSDESVAQSFHQEMVKSHWWKD